MANGDEKLLFTEQILEASKFIAGSSCQISIIIDSSCPDLAVVLELRGVLQLPELHARYHTYATVIT